MADINPNLKDRLLNELSSSIEPTSQPPLSEAPAPPPALPDHTLLRLIGKGSYGEVWLARNVLGTPRAVKIVSRRSFDSDRPYEREFAGIRRFEPVSRSHPSQLNVLHAGRDDTAGYFYYVMELADDANAVDPSAGLRSPDRLTALPPDPPSEPCALGASPPPYAPRTLRSELQRRGRLPVQECLNIGLALATALDHLHQHGLVHRDIKPSNIVFVNGIPKLADIGLVTHVEASLSFVGTEGYLPPEGPGTPQADIYSLGKVLYEMATGRDRQQYPELPTNLIDVPAPERAALAELNEVIVKACQAESKHRYRTAAELHADLALLHSGESVCRMRRVEERLRFLQRAGALVGIVAVITGGLYLWQARQTRAMRELADKQSALAQENGRLAKESRQVSQFLKAMLHGVGPAVALGRDTTLLRDILDRTAAGIGTELKEQPEIEAELRTTLGIVYREIEQVEKSEAMLREALAIRQRVFQEHPAVADSLMELAETLEAYLAPAEADVLHQRLSPALTAKLAEAERFAGEGLAMWRRLRKHEHPDVAAALGTLSLIKYRKKELDQAEALAREGLNMARLVLPNDHPVVLHLINNLANVLAAVGQLAEAEALYREALPIERRHRGNVHPVLSVLLSNLSLVLDQRGYLAEAESFAQEVVTMERQLGRDQPRGLARQLNMLADVLGRRGKLVEAEAALREALPLKIALYSEDHLEVAAIQDNLASVLVDQGRYAEAEPLHEQALRLRRKLVGNDHPHVAISLNHLGNLRERQGRLVEAETFQREAVANERPRIVPGESNVPEIAGASRLVWFLEDLARVLHRQARPVEAESAWREALDLLRQPFGSRPPPQTPTVGKVLHHLAEALLEKQELPEARRLAEESVALYQRHAEWPPAEREHAFGVFLNVLSKIEGPAAAIEACREEVTRLQSRTGSNPDEVGTVLHKQAMLFKQAGKTGEAESTLREALQHLRAGPQRTNSTPSHVLAAVLHHLAELLQARRELAPARELAQEAVELYARYPSWPASERQHAAEIFTDILTHLGEFATAEKFSRDEIARLRGLLGTKHPEVASLLHTLGLLLRHRGEVAEGEAALREALECLRLPGTTDQWHLTHLTGVVLHHLADTLRGRQELGEARFLAGEAVALYARHSHWPQLERQHANSVLKDILFDAQDFAGVESLCRERLHDLRSAMAPDSPEVTGALAELALALLYGQKFADAEPIARECLELRQETIPDDWRTFNTQALVGGSLLGQKRYSDAEPLLLAGYEGMMKRRERIPPQGKRRVKETLQRLVQLYEETDRAEVADEWRQRLTELDESNARR